VASATATQLHVGKFVGRTSADRSRSRGIQAATKGIKDAFDVEIGWSFGGLRFEHCGWRGSYRWRQQGAVARICLAVGGGSEIVTMWAG
jgi:hypothetical protein